MMTAVLSKRKALVCGLLFVQVGADGQSRVWIHRAIALLDVLDDAVLVDHDVGALSPLIGFIFLVVVLKHAVGGKHFFVHVAEEGELDIDLLSECRIRGGAIHAHAKNFGVGGVDLTSVYSRLDRLELLGSTTCKGQYVNGQ